MTHQELVELSRSHGAPFNHADYTVWLHNKIIEAVREDVFELSQKISPLIISSTVAVGTVLNLPILKPIQ